MSSTRTNVVRTSSKGVKSVSAWSRATQADSEWQDKVSAHGQLQWQSLSCNFYVSPAHTRLPFYRNIFLFAISGRVFGCSLLVSTSIRHYHRRFLGHLPAKGFRCARIVSPLLLLVVTFCYLLTGSSLPDTVLAYRRFRFAAINCGIVYIYCVNFQKIDEEEYGGIWELMKEGFMTSFACFLVTWIVFYTGLHFDKLNATAF